MSYFLMFLFPPAVEILSGWIAAGSWSDDWRLPRGLIDGAEVFVVFPPPPPSYY